MALPKITAQRMVGDLSACQCGQPSSVRLIAPDGDMAGGYCIPCATRIISEYAIKLEEMWTMAPAIDVVAWNAERMRQSASFTFDDLIVTCPECGETDGMTYVQDGAEYYDVEDVEWRNGEPTLIASVRRDFECSEQRFLCKCGHTWPVPAQVDVDVL